MKPTVTLFLPFAAALLLTPLALRAQTTVTVDPAPSPTPMLVQPVAGGTPMEVIPVQTATPAAVEVAPDTTTTTTTTTTAAATPLPPLQPGQHIAEIFLTVSHGSVQAYFGRASRDETLSVGDFHLSFKAPSTATVEKLASRDKTSNDITAVTPGTPWHVTVPFDGPGRFVFNMVEWDNDPVVTECIVKVDGVVMFSGHGSHDDINDWTHRHYGEGVRKTGSREIAFIEHGAR